MKKIVLIMSLLAAVVMAGCVGGENEKQAFCTEFFDFVLHTSTKAAPADETGGALTRYEYAVQECKDKWHAYESLDQCEGSLYCYQYVGYNLGPDSCNVDDPDARIECEIGNGVFRKDASLCKLAPHICNKFIAHAVKDESYCAQIDPEKVTHYHCFKDVAFYKKDISICEQIEDAYLVDKCKYHHMRDSREFKKEVCEEFSDDQTKLICIASYEKWKQAQEEKENSPAEDVSTQESTQEVTE